MSRPSNADPGPGGIVVIGAGGHAKVVIATILASGAPVLAVEDDDAAKWGHEELGFKIRAPQNTPSARAIVAIGDNSLRQKVVKATNSHWEKTMHPTACVHATVRIGRGTVVCAGAVIQPDAVIGEHVIVNTAATIDHDCQIGDFAHIAPGVHLAGAVEIGEGAFLGIGSVVLPGVKIGRWTTVGAGAVVTADLPDAVVAYGVPARIRNP